MKQAFIVNLDGVIPAFRQSAEECIEMSDEFSSTLPITRVEVGKLEDNRSDPIAIRFERAEEASDEKILIEKPGD